MSESYSFEEKTDDSPEVVVEEAETYRFDDEKTIAYFSKFLTAKDSVPEYQQLVARSDERSRIVLPVVDEFFDDLLSMTCFLSNCCCLYDEELPKSVYTNLRNCVWMMPKRVERYKFIQVNLRRPDNEEIDDEIIVGEMALDYESFDGRRYDHSARKRIYVLSDRERGFWMTVFDRLAIEGLRGLIAELTRLANSVSSAQLRRIPTTVAEVDDFIRAEREARRSA